MAVHAATACWQEGLDMFEVISRFDPGVAVLICYRTAQSDLMRLKQSTIDIASIVPVDRRSYQGG